METFAEYLSFYVKRAGISDAELARAIDVSRQTVFRWKEGLTSRPNNRDDVLAIAKKLRLSLEETNMLLQAAGFRPQSQPSNTQEGSQQPVQNDIDIFASSDPLKENVLQADPAYLWRHLLKMPVRKKWLIIAVGCELALFMLIGILMNIDYSPSKPDKPAETTPVYTGESLIMVSPLSNSDISYFSHQLSDSIEREISAHRITGYRVAELGNTVTDEREAKQLLQNAGTDLVIYGSIEEGLINVRFLPEMEEIGADGISIQSNPELPLQTQAVALLALAHLSIRKNDPDRAMSLLSQARNTLSDNVENDPLLSIVSSSLDQLQNISGKTSQ